jgi:hypothetical protein
MTYMGRPCYPRWLDEPADDATSQGAAVRGTLHGPEEIRTLVLGARAEVLEVARTNLGQLATE